jgi:hypothetical protein
LEAEKKGALLLMEIFSFVIPFWAILLILVVVAFIAWKLIKFALWILLIFVIIILGIIGLDFLVGLFSRIGL